MLQLFNAIQVKFDGHTDLSNSVTELSLFRASRDASYPYIVYFPHSGSPHFALGVDDMEKVYIQFSIFSSTSDYYEVMHIYELLTSVFDNCDMPMDDWNLIYMHRISNFLAQDDSGKKVIWHYMVDYELDIDAHPYLTTTVSP